MYLVFQQSLSQDTEDVNVTLSMSTCENSTTYLGSTLGEGAQYSNPSIDHCHLMSERELGKATV